MTTLALFVALSPAAIGDDPARTHFEAKVRPLLAGRCVSCHGPEKAKGGLRLDAAANAAKGGDSGPAWVAGNPAKSLIVLAVRGTRPDHAGAVMPPKAPLAAAEIDALAAWVEAGAVWPDAVAAVAGRVGDAWTDPANPIRKAFAGERLDLWSLRKPARPELPAVKGVAPNPIDHFVLAKLEAAGMTLSAGADRRTLIRRLSFDLHGLPPTPAEGAAFAADARPDAYERLVERLLASPRYGERWARHWLDVARYGDSNGFERDEFRPQMWRYRDYVVRSFNADKPYDRFVTEQLAGDEIAAGPIQSAADADRWVATGFLRLGPNDTTAAVFREDDRERDQVLTDLTNTTASAFLGLTYTCCQCHDHKYEPLTQADHFRLRAFFAAVKPTAAPIDPPAERTRIEAHNAAIDAQVRAAKAGQAALLAPAKKLVRAWRTAMRRKKVDVTDATALSLTPAGDRQRYRDLGQSVGALNAKKLGFTTAAAMTDGPATATHLNAQGDYKKPRAEVQPGVPSVFDPNPLPPAAVPTKTTGRRTALARWVASPDNPLTARVMVNRLWQHHFGRGLVATPNDFGYAGAGPSHPELLDWLATEFVKSGWSVKAMHRLMVTSAAYRQASVETPGHNRDSDNRLLHRQAARRLDAESLRDALLLVSGRLRPDAGGPPRWPAVAEDILLSNPAIFEAREGKAGGRLQDYVPDPDDRADVRSLYLVQKRSVPYPFLQPFDLPDTGASCGCRAATTVAPQALALLNSPTAARVSKAFAGRVATEAGSDPGRQVETAFALALTREPTADERALARRLVADYGLDALARALLNLNEFVTVD
jgi:mono/diheme cytochrome c family protein